jgi:hypothetical protein
MNRKNSSQTRKYIIALLIAVAFVIFIAALLLIPSVSKTSIYHAIYINDKELVKKLIAQGVDVKRHIIKVLFLVKRLLLVIVFFIPLCNLKASNISI